MLLGERTVHGFAREMVVALESISEPVSAGAGRAWVAPEFGKMGLAVDLLYQKWVDAGWLVAESGPAGFHNLLGWIGFRNRELLVEHRVEDVSPEGWHWTIDAWELDGRGYIIPLLDAGFGLHLPLLASWEPFADRDAFAQAFAGAFRNNVWMLGCGKSFELGDRVPYELYESALVGGVEASEEYAGFVRMLFDDETGDLIDEVTRRHLPDCRRG